MVLELGAKLIKLALNLLLGRHANSIRTRYPVRMEPVTHILTGAVLARAGLNRKAAYMTAAMAIAAEFPDIDTVWGAAGPVASLEHHRGITHTFVGLPVEAALLTLGFYAWHRWRGKPGKVATNWWWLYGGMIVALLSHLLLDWTNNYGLRPFFPFNPRWYAGSFVFIFEPVLFLLLLAALVGPALFGLINAEVGARRPLFRGRPSAIAALVGIALLYIFRYGEHAKALALTAQNAPADFIRASASPYPIDPFRGTSCRTTATATSCKRCTPAPASSTRRALPTRSTSPPPRCLRSSPSAATWAASTSTGRSTPC